MIRIVKKFSGIMTHEQKVRVVILAALMVVGAILEMGGVSLVFPLMTAVMDKDFLDTWYMQIVCDAFHIQTGGEAMILILSALIFIYIVKNAFLFFEYYLQYRFVCNNRFRVQRQLLQVYMYRPYEFYLNATTAEIMRIINTDVVNAFNLLTTVLNFFTEIIVSAALIIIIFVIDPVMAAMIGLVLGFIMLLIFKAVKPVLRRASQRFMKNTSLSNKWLLQSLNGMKDVKVSHKEEYFIEEYANKPCGRGTVFFDRRASGVLLSAAKRRGTGRLSDLV